MLCRFTGANHIHSVQLCLLLNRLSPPFPTQFALFDLGLEMLAHFVAPQNLSYLQGNLGGRQRFVFAAGRFPYPLLRRFRRWLPLSFSLCSSLLVLPRGT